MGNLVYEAPTDNIDNIIEGIMGRQIGICVVGVKKEEPERLEKFCMSQGLVPPDTSSGLELSLIAYDPTDLENTSVDFIVSNPVRTSMKTYYPVSIKLQKEGEWAMGTIEPTKEIDGMKGENANMKETHYFPSKTKGNFEVARIPLPTYLGFIDEMARKYRKLSNRELGGMSFKEFMEEKQETVKLMNDFHYFLLGLFDEDRLIRYEASKKKPILTNYDQFKDVKEQLGMIVPRSDAYLFGDAEDLRLLNGYKHGFFLSQLALTGLAAHLANDNNVLQSAMSILATISGIDFSMRGMNMLAREVPVGALSSAIEIISRVKKQSQNL